MIKTFLDEECILQDLFLGGGYNNQESGSSCPLFLGYYEESHFLAPHYQSVVPTRDSSVLKMMRENDGYDVARGLGFQYLSGQFFSMCRLDIFIIFKLI